MRLREIVAIIVTTSVLNIGTVMTVWWQLDSKIDREIAALDTDITALDTKFDTKFDALNKLLTDNLLEMKGDIGELKGASHSHNP